MIRHLIHNRLFTTEATKRPERSHLTMMKYFFALLILTSGIGYGQVTTSHEYYGARNAAMAGSEIAHPEDGWSIFTNPAGLSALSGISGVFSYENALGQSFLPHTTGALTYSTEKWGTFGVSLDRMAVSYGGNQLTSELAAGVYQGFYLQHDENSSLAIGYGLKLLQVDYGKSAGPSGDGSDGIDLGTSQALGVDIGFLAGLSDRHYLGAQVMNINAPKMGSGNALVDLPVKIRIGAAYSPYHFVWTNFSLTRVAGQKTQYHAGIEYNILDQLSLYTGIHSNPNRFGAGIHFRWRSFNIDYGLLTHPVFPLTHQFSLGVTL